MHLPSNHGTHSRKPDNPQEGWATPNTILKISSIVSLPVCQKMFWIDFHGKFNWQSEMWLKMDPLLCRNTDVILNPL